jgi:uncharacterized membrane protein YhaH (DUF805 family)
VISFWFFGILASFAAHLVASSLGVTLPRALSGALDVIWSFALDWPFVPLLARRLHDQGRSTSWTLLWGVPLISFAILFLLPESADGQGPSISFFSFHRWLAWTPVTTPLLLTLTIALIALPILYLLPPTPGTNRYGQDPRVAPADDVTNFGGELATR